MRAQGPYRAPARSRPASDLPAPPADAGRSAAVLGSLAVTGVASAAAMGSVELAALAGAGALLGLARWIRELHGRRRRGAMMRFLGGERCVASDSGWSSPCGERRVRATEDGHACFEVVDPSSGRTLRSHRLPSGEGPALEPSPVRERFVATLHGRALEPCCFDGPPPELGRGARRRAARYVVIEVARERTRVERRDDSGALVGDTVHADLASARRQLAAEYGAHLGVLRPAGEGAPERPREGWEPAPPSRLGL